MPELKVAVLFGGRSGEHQVSLVSAKSVLGNLDADRYALFPVWITPQGEWVVGEGAWQALGGEPVGTRGRLALALRAPHGTLIEVEAGQGGLVEALHEIDVVFPVLHGPFGEDGAVQGLLEMANLPYVGAGVLGSAVGMDKGMMKALWQQQGLPVVEHMLFRRSQWESEPEAVLDEVEREIGYPCFTKPANMGSSVGVSKARSRPQLGAGLSVAAAFDARIIIERGLDARELECSVLGNEHPRASVLGEVVPAHEFYDYEAKYADVGSRLFIPAELPDAMAAEARRLAVEAFRALDCQGMARVDFFLERSTGRLFLNEINTIPGFTSISMYPKLWEASGLPYSQLLDELIRLALERHADRSRNQVDHRDQAKN